ncbi:MAG: hypothetical protein HWE30_08955 [Methylocystaceae bacterium]|nr:hypothetical protein [Methylocystaceae bacterium]
MTEPRFVFFHKQPTSARMRFMVFDNGSVLSGPSLPVLNVVEEVERDYDDEDVVAFPDNGLVLILDKIGVAKSDATMAFPDVASVDTADGFVPIHGVKFTEIDPPFDQVAEAGAKFIEMTQARQLSATDMEIIRRIYIHAMGG